MKRNPNYHAERCRELSHILIPALREVARRHGYALGVHGSLAYDIDLIAAPWEINAADPHVLIEAIRKAAEAIVGFGVINEHEKLPEKKPFGRLGWSIHLGGGPYLDISVCPRIIEQKEAAHAKPGSKRRKQRAN